MNTKLYDYDHTYQNKPFKEIPYTWVQLQTKIKNNDLDDINIGDYKDIELTTGEKVRMEVAGINTYKDYGYPNIISNHIDFISKDCLNKSYQMRSTDTNNGNSTEKNSFRASELFTTLNTTIYDTLPSDVKNLIVEKIIVTSTRYSSTETLTKDNLWEWGTFGKLWLPSEVEVFGHSSWSTIGYESGQYIQYPIFAKFGMDRIVKHGGYEGTTRYAWWLCSAGGSNSAHFCSVDDHGYSGNWATASDLLGVPLCFRIQ